MVVNLLYSKLFYPGLISRIVMNDANNIISIIRDTFCLFLLKLFVI